MTLPMRVQEQLQAAEALESADRAARSQVAPAISSAADLVAQPQPAPVSVAPPAPAAAAPPPAPRAPEDFEQKYKTLQGMYNADVRGFNTKLTELTAVVQTLQAEKRTAPEEKPAVDPKDIENFGAEMMEMVQRYVTGAVKALDARIATLEATVNGVSAQAASSQEQAFYALLSKLVPDWKQINEDQRWLAWLGVKDEVYGLPRQAALDNAFKNGDAQQVANVFNAFRTSLPVTPAAPSLEDQIVPESAGNPAAPVPIAKPILSTKAVTAFYNDLGRGKYVGREAEAEAIEDQINLAVAEGRVR